MLVYRISSPKYITDLTGTGSKQYGGRWNEKGISVVYFAESRAMAVMEILMHLRPEELDRDYNLAVFEIPDGKILNIKIEDLPDDWKSENCGAYLKRIGAEFVRENKYLLMRVPSVILEEEHNYILNPDHKDAGNIKLLEKRVFRFDRRFKN
jgi:RES domain-containing protein